ncbi:hypothetical protein GLOIN_2v366287 [Rhizophagus irregularis DAOM 181602=DAOM 197198]|uniref:Uncharacterized protein n=1 Tax=Rhizophagus irregularis (strain DAOM 181602 / DAOM 197198 / MUCL 43194) TaxID=747089 RepID=A0A2P4PLM6_RHIID|nr:hypothetical protein GLOIN_2v366287 [Rhizophagus irregularis DAOM 181602=DAOM 197198]POG66292.1 hypothetical protein GLOIN_2v366287 [Rhizophagus irregularis DAOM 181602=DAOM 197198]GET50133.1 hypothetical protein GLOIN_2v366287 [Rhizophagus irregularis DAOM 181602=DAOM 197198]|eukprot:XP_025173158.1 hypothetical protein GLOIN_2v366287 [Rhizophagus irregularis DAOM 181602=DAOM 197198]
MSYYSSLIYYLIPITSFNPIIINPQRISFIYKLKLKMSSDSLKTIYNILLLIKAYYLLLIFHSFINCNKMNVKRFKCTSIEL